MISTVIVYLMAAVLVYSAPVQQDLPVSIPFYGMLYSNQSTNGRISSTLRKEIVRLNGIAEHYIELQKDQKVSSLLRALDSEINMELVTLVPVGHRKFTVDSTLRPSFYDSLRLFRSDYNVSLGFVSPPEMSSADVIVSSANRLIAYYLKQININLKKERDNNILQVDSVFIRRDLNVSKAVVQSEGLIMVKSIWNYSLEISSDRYATFEMHNVCSDAFISVGTEPSTTTAPLRGRSNLPSVSLITYLLTLVLALLL